MATIDERYKRGQIYTIRNINDDTMIYVGSTIDNLPRRFYKHKLACKNSENISLYNYITDNDWTNWYIELYEVYPCNNRYELDRKEGQIIREIGTINKCIAGRTKKEYREDNKDVLLENKKKYYEGNKEILLENAKNYYDDNKQKINERTKIYYQNNKEILLEKFKEKVCCDICGAFLTKPYLKRHQKSKKCLVVANK